MEFILGILLSPLFFLSMLLLAILTDYKECRGWAGFYTLVGVGCAVAFTGASLATIGIVAAAWLPVGIAWSIWRWSRHCNSILRKVERGDVSKSRAKTYLSPKSNTQTICYWVLFWPISLVASLLSDILRGVEVLVTEVFAKTYAKISGNALNKLDTLEEGKSKSSSTWKEH